MDDVFERKGMKMKVIVIVRDKSVPEYHSIRIGRC